MFTDLMIQLWRLNKKVNELLYTKITEIKLQKADVTRTILFTAVFIVFMNLQIKF